MKTHISHFIDRVVRFCDGLYPITHSMQNGEFISCSSKVGIRLKCRPKGAEFLDRRMLHFLAAIDTAAERHTHAFPVALPARQE